MTIEGVEEDIVEEMKEAEVSIHIEEIEEAITVVRAQTLESFSLGFD
jgi:hypothetical protein